LANRKNNLFSIPDNLPFSGYDAAMKLTAKVKLLPSKEQAVGLKETLKQANVACNSVSDIAWEHKEFHKYGLHKIAYHETRASSGLTAQVVVRCISRVADAYKLDKKTKRKFKPLSSIAYDDRILRWYVDKSEVSIWTVNGRQRITFVCGERQRCLLSSRQGETDLMLHRGKFYLATICNVDELDPKDVDDALGIDLGIVNIAVDSDGEVHSGSQVKSVRHRHRRLRTKLKRKGTKSAKRLFNKMAGKEARFAKDVNHTIAKHIVVKAKGTHRGIVLEDLNGIRDRVTARRSQRATLSSWSFFQLRQYISYKARLVGVPVFLVDPRNTSRTCPACGCIDKRNRPNQATFSCVSCSFAGPADTIAADNIRRVAVNQPYADRLRA